MTTNKYWMLQMFAEGGGDAGGEGAASTGDNGVDPGHQRLLELGVPADKIRKRAKRVEEKLPEGAVSTSPQAQTQSAQQAAAAQPTEAPKDEPKRMSWAEIMADPEYNKQMQSVVQSRLKSAKRSADALQNLNPALAIIAKSYGLDPQKLDYKALSNAIMADDKLYAEKAAEMGVTPSVARQLDQYEMEKNRRAQQEKDYIQRQAMQRHFTHLEQQAEEMKAVFPNFNLQQELKNPVFARMVAPGSNVPVRSAYYALHHDEIQSAQAQVVAQQTARQISNAIQSGSRMPAENGTSGQAPSVTTFDYKKASKSQREALKREILAAGARGEKLYPGK